MYRTGDRGHFLPDGRLVFVGRDDDQVKLFGRRIALGEIESALRHLDGVQEAVVVVHEQGTARARLSAFVQTRGDDISSTELRSRLRAVLPTAMIPMSIAIVQSWPRLISGKIDRRALAQRAPQLVASIALTSAAERAIAAAFSRVLGIGQKASAAMTTSLNWAAARARHREVGRRTRPRGSHTVSGRTVAGEPRVRTCDTHRTGHIPYGCAGCINRHARLPTLLGGQT